MKKKRILCIVLSVVMVLSVITGLNMTNVFADDDNETYTPTAATFFYWLYEETGDTYSLKAYELLTTGTYDSVDITSKKNGEFYSATELGAEGDATSLEYLQETIQWLYECNELRANDDNFTNLSDLKVNSLLMAMAEIDTNWSASNTQHALVFSVGENLAWGYSDPFVGWYTAEKAVYDAGTSGTTGHYINIVSSSYTTTGFAYTKGSDVTYGRAHGQVFSGSSKYEKYSYTVAEYEEYLNEYVVYLHEQGILEHEYDDGVTVEPTCTEEGTITYTCTVCGATEVETTPATGHTEVTDEAVEATCTETGLTEGSHCVTCGEVLVAQEEIPATGHTYDEGTTVEATCVDGGYTTYTCTVCGDTYTDDYTEATGHVYDDGVTVEVTCTEDGYTVYTCTVCGETKTDDVVETEGHTVVTDEAVEATCTETGLTEGSHCSVCGEVLVAQEEIPATGHSYEEVVTEPTCTDDGYTTYTCTVCGDTYTDNYTEATGHNYEVTDEAEATCVDDGYTTYTCTSCGDTYTDEIPATGHTEVTDEAVEATCTETGLTEGSHCITCGEVFTPQEETEATGHSYEEIIVDATCTEMGYTIYVCSNCEDSYTTDYTEATGHDYAWTVDDDDQPVKACTACGDVITTITFTDLADSEYSNYYGRVAYMSVYNSFMEGTSDSTYSPLEKLTRADVIEILYKMAGSPYDDGANPYTEDTYTLTDVDSDDEYYNAVCWAINNHITTKNVTFSPDAHATRQQVVTFLYRYVKYCTDIEVTTKSIGSFPDASSVSDYAINAMKWAYANGVLTGNTSGNLNPKGATYRIYASKMFYQFGMACGIGVTESEYLASLVDAETTEDVTEETTEATTEDATDVATEEATDVTTEETTEATAEETTEEETTAENTESGSEAEATSEEVDFMEAFRNFIFS